MGVNPSNMLSEDQMKLFKEQGFLVVDNLFTPEECDEINARAVDAVTGKVQLAKYNAVYMEPEAIEQGLTSDAHPDPAYLFKIGHAMHVDDPVFRYYAMHENILDTLEQLTAPDLKCVQSMYIDKPSNIGVGQPYHQDSYYIKMDPDSLIAVWVACDNVDETNGCLHVVPGSHHDPIHPHDTPIDPKQRKYFVEVLSARERAEVTCRLPKGGAVFFLGKLLHRSGNNHTPDRQRRSYVLHYADARAKSLNNPTARHPHMLVRGRQYPGCI